MPLICIERGLFEFEPIVIDKDAIGIKTVLINRFCVLLFSDLADFVIILGHTNVVKSSNHGETFY